MLLLSYFTVSISVESLQGHWTGFMQMTLRPLIRRRSKANFQGKNWARFSSSGERSLAVAEAVLGHRSLRIIKLAGLVLLVREPA